MARRSPAPAREGQARLTFSSRRRWLWPTVALVVVIGALAGVVTLLRRTPAPPPPRVSHLLSPLANGLDCAMDAAWSPDSPSIAVLGYLRACPDSAPQTYTYVPGVLDVYDATTGALVQQLAPDDAVERAQGIAFPSYATPVPVPGAARDTSDAVVTYSHVLWSPDGSQLALTFHVIEWQSPSSARVWRELWLVNRSTGATRVLLHEQTASDPAALEWDLATGTASAPQDATRGMPSTSLPPAAGYGWQPGGAITPSGALTSAGTPASGGAGGASLSIWQAGTPSLDVRAGAQVVVPGAYLWQSDFAAWSPDGRYIMTPIASQVRVQPPGLAAPSAAGLAALSVEGNPVASASMGLLRVYGAMPRAGFDAFGQSAIVASSPTTGTVASVASSVPTASVSAYTVTLYAGPTGKQLGTLVPHSDTEYGMQGGATLLRWSPDGARLLLLQADLGTVSVWSGLP